MDKIKLIIKDCREHLRLYEEAFITEKELDLIEKRIQELEEEKKNRADFQQKYIEVTGLYLNSIPKQKIKNEIEILRKMLKATIEGKLQEYTPPEIIIKINTLEELLEDK